MKTRRAALVLAIVLGSLSPSAPRAQGPPAQSAPPALALSEPLLAKLPPDWRHAALTILTIPDAQQRQLIAQQDDVMRQTIARLLARNAAADEFLKGQLRTDPAPRVRTTIVQVIAADARWLALPDTLPLIERVAATDPDAGVSVAALETLRRYRMRQLNALLNERVTAAKTGADDKGLARLADEQERWFSLERGSMLPAFLRTPPAPFSIAPAEKAVRVIAFGDFGTGSWEQTTLAQTIVAYHGRKPFDFGITLGDNFYSVGMESPADPRWRTQWEDLYGPMGITFYAALGNHDWGHPDSPAAEVLYSRDSKTWRMPASYYTFTAGAVQFFALDTQSVAVTNKQLQWLDRELARSQARWKVVYGHHPIYSGGNYEDRPDLIARLLPVLKDRADVYICGHDHNLQALKPDAGVRFYVAGGGGAGLYELREYERSVFASRTNGFAMIEADASELKVTFVDVTGKEIYEETLKKPAPTTAARQ